MAQHSMDRNDILDISLRMSGHVGEKENPSTEQYKVAANFINMVHNELSNVGAPLIQLELKSTTVSTVSFNLEAEDEHILMIYKSASDVDDPPMRKLSYSEYYGGISDKTNTGTPYSYYLDYQGTRVCYLYPVPSASTTIKYLAQKRFDALSASTDIPLDARYYSYLVFEVAYKLSMYYRVDSAHIAWLKSEKEDLKKAVTSRDKKRYNSSKKGAY